MVCPAPSVAAPGWGTGEALLGTQDAMQVAPGCAEERGRLAWGARAEGSATRTTAEADLCPWGSRSEVRITKVSILGKTAEIQT